MRIDIIVPNYVAMWDTPIRNQAQRLISPDTELTVHHLDLGTASMESVHDVAMSSRHIVNKARQVERSGADGVIIYCYKDPALAACKEKLSIPVVGIREAALAYAGLLGDDVGLICSGRFSEPSNRRELAGRVKLVTSLQSPVLELADHDKVSEVLDQRIAELAAGGCDVISLGCGAILGLDFSSLEKKHGISIIMPLAAAINICEYMVHNRLMQSRIAFPPVS